MYRILAERRESRERRPQRAPRSFPKPSLQATAPNQVWTWDITKLPTFTAGIFLSLYVILDLWSRYVVAWMVAQRENSALAKQLFAEAITRYEIAPRRLLVHMDRGAPMTSAGFADLLSVLGVDQSFSRPRVSNDNPFSEAHFKTLKYQPDYPGAFHGARDARSWAAHFFTWYNTAHHHHGIALYTPETLFLGRLEEVAARRQAALDVACEAHPERFVHGPPNAPMPPAVVAINPATSDYQPLSAETLLAALDPHLLFPPQSPPVLEATAIIATPGAKANVAPMTPF
jgi:putative transposase